VELQTSAESLLLNLSESFVACVALICSRVSVCVIDYRRQSICHLFLVIIVQNTLEIFDFFQWISGHDDDFIKLYDLTTLCSNLVDDTTTNPFTVPVGILLYRVARNMRMQGRQKSNIVRSLLEKCLLLLDAVKHAQVTDHECHFTNFKKSISVHEFAVESWCYEWYKQRKTELL